MNIVKHRYLYFLISVIIILPGLIALGVWGLPLSHDFTGGSMLEVQFEEGKALAPAEITGIYQSMDISDPFVQTSDDNIRII
ncbi:hypothetical protein, partial [Klebsiella pneumoniae]|uniref:hypothetical protein n=1 Tax=Klebsiella pneumoniae TaxID=573 RepID=UPI001C8F808D